MRRIAVGFLLILEAYAARQAVSAPPTEKVEIQPIVIRGAGKLVTASTSTPLTTGASLRVPFGTSVVTSADQRLVVGVGAARFVLLEGSNWDRVWPEVKSGIPFELSRGNLVVALPPGTMGSPISLAAKHEWMIGGMPKKRSMFIMQPAENLVDTGGQQWGAGTWIGLIEGSIVPFAGNGMADVTEAEPVWALLSSGTPCPPTKIKGANGKPAELKSILQSVIKSERLDQVPTQ